MTYLLFKENPSLLLDLLATGVGLMGMQSFLTWGATYTIMAHANLFSSLVSVIIVGYRLLTFKQISKFEVIGTSIAILGCAMTTLDSSADKVDPETKDI
jgi:drug/metabolite transporter (DMT)-like permease